MARVQNAPIQAPPRRVCLKIAAAAEVDPRTAAKYFASPDHCHALAINAIRRALPTLGIADPHAGVEL